ncbi:TPR-like protein [Punctularia strigosozonata HHB-11173 SS5]|uniref:TPR-like protein n=1 Tax=Punctularia strigosozonata (strain HHB-11173) TaxID=741275 RepID=UPI0004416767|nr:TPR-like protein [Punctularia strigosozonata HHB-11173 SS5]EIN14593.1 TPR-like protein [Punctularia strigosozonata HHB-11173 SS5]
MSSVDSSNPPLAVALERLANHRTRRTRDSQDVFNAGMVVLEKNAVNKMGDERWAFLEQLALAALDVGRTDIADTCIGLLNNQFSDSPRVDCLKGIKIEATAGPEAAREYYESLLEADSSNVAIWKRLITVYRSQGNVDKTVEELHQFLDTVYTDLEGWLELADVYDSVGLYTSALQALSHAILLAPQNQFYILKAAETADKAGDVPLALKMHLLVIDMATDDDDPKTSTDPPGGVAVRAWMGVKSVRVLYFAY